MIIKRVSIILGILAGTLCAYPLELQVKPGELGSKLENIDKGATSLYLTGSIDARDLAQLRNVPENFQTLDMKQCEVVEYKGSVAEYPGRNYFAAGELPDHLLFGSHYKTIALPVNIVKMGKGVCANSANLQEAWVSQGSLEISDYAFYGCSSLQKVSLPSSLERLGVRAMANCPQLIQADLTGTKVTTIPEGCFAGDSRLTNLRLPSGITTVGGEAFAWTSITYLNLPSLKESAPYALANMPELQCVTLNSKANYSIGFLMGDSNLSEVNNAPAEVPDLFLANATGIDVTGIAGNASSIGRYAFARADMDSIALSETLEYVDRGAFAYAPNLNVLDVRNLENNIPATSVHAFDGIDQPNVVLRVTADSADAWKEHPQWGLFKVESGTTDVADTMADALNVNIALAGHRLKVTSPTEITDCHVWLADGAPVWQGKSAGGVIDVELPLQEGQQIVIVKVATERGSRTATILTR